MSKAVLAYRLVKQQRPRTSLNLLWALAAALNDQDSRELSADDKEKLRQAVQDDRLT